LRLRLIRKRVERHLGMTSTARRAPLSQKHLSATAEGPERKLSAAYAGPGRDRGSPAGPWSPLLEDVDRSGNHHGHGEQ
jgi:hypothetical protein